MFPYIWNVVFSCFEVSSLLFHYSAIEYWLWLVFIIIYLYTHSIFPFCLPAMISVFIMCLIWCNAMTAIVALTCASICRQSSEQFHNLHYASPFVNTASYLLLHPIIILHKLRLIAHANVLLLATMPSHLLLLINCHCSVKLLNAIACLHYPYLVLSLLCVWLVGTSSGHSKSSSSTSRT